MKTIPALSYAAAASRRAVHTDETDLPGGGTHAPATETLPPDAAQELRELLAYVPRRVQTVLRAYNSKGKLTAVGAMRFTPLHIAVMYQCVALTRELLRQGADPGATLKPQDASTMPDVPEPLPRTPLLWIFRNLTTLGNGYDADKINRIIDLLVEHGVNLRSKEGGQALYDCAATLEQECEDIFLHLLDHGARPQDGYLPQQACICCGMVLYAGFVRAAKCLIFEGLLDINGRDVNGESYLTNALRSVGRFYASDMSFIDEETADNIYRRNLVSLRLLLEQGAKGINEVHPREGAAAATALSFIIEKLPPNATSQQIERAGELIHLLVQHGADLHMPIPCDGQNAPDTFTAADMLRDKPALATWLQQHGITPPLRHGDAINVQQIIRPHARLPYLRQLGRGNEGNNTKIESLKHHEQVYRISGLHRCVADVQP